ncbi:unnamed protein product [Rhizoctonia solani]|uniref:Uncharacterized protein n=1 Tax=Rhizoctonia solani TaxID=456999 RepID=A0A8H3D2R0_9AGAM|nr:unnamed protein product [Rhizoctonia solani]
MTLGRTKSIPNTDSVLGAAPSINQLPQGSQHGAHIQAPTTSTSTANSIFFEQRQKNRGLVMCRVRRCTLCGNTIEIGGGNGDHELYVHQNGKKSCLNVNKTSHKPPKKAHKVTKGHPDSNLGSAPALGTGYNSISEYPCFGAVVPFSSTVFTLYPWALHRHIALPFSVIGIELGGFAVRVRSVHCKGITSLVNEPCQHCAWVPTSADIHLIQQRATSTPPDGLNYHYMNFDQIINALRDKNKQINELKLKVLEKSNRIESLTRQLGEHKELYFELGSCEIPWLHRLFRIAHLKNLRVADILDRVRQAKLGKYETKGYSVSGPDHI